jgi:DNA-binding CsgD family transcriptional regulator
MPVPAGLSALVADRVGRLAPSLTEIAAGTAAAWRFNDAGLDPDDLDAAVEAGLVTVADPRGPGPRIVRAAHPLLGAAAYTSLTPGRRRRLHQRLAVSVEDPVERARHAALAGIGPDPEVAAALDAGVRAALSAGTPDIAADLGRLVIARFAVTPDRLDRLADALFRTGDVESAMAEQRRSIALSVTVRDRVRRRIRLAEIMVEVDGWDDGEAELVTAVAEADGHPAAMAEALSTLAAVTDDVPRALDAATRAVALLDRPDDPDPAALGPALAQLAGARFAAGDGLDHALFARAIDLERRYSNRRLSDRADASYAALLKYADDLDGAEQRLSALLAEARESGDLSSIAYAVAHLPQIALWRGELARAHEYADEHLAVAAQGGFGAQVTQARYSRASVLAHEGALDEAEEILVAVRDAPRAACWERIRACGFLGFIALSRDDPVTAAAHLDEWDGLLRGIGFDEPGYSRSQLDYVVALVGCGRTDDASTFLDRLAVQAARSGRASASAVVGTGRALVASAAGRPDDAMTEIEESLRWYDESPLRFDRARTLLLAGQIRRRAKAKSAARTALDEASAEFRLMGATAWADRAAAEIARVSPRPQAPTDLTETERRIAELAATGLTNREVGMRLFLTVKTVESNLVRAYRKLGIRSRAELGIRLRGDR